MTVTLPNGTIVEGAIWELQQLGYLPPPQFNWDGSMPLTSSSAAPERSLTEEVLDGVSPLPASASVQERDLTEEVLDGVSPYPGEEPPTGGFHA